MSRKVYSDEERRQHSRLMRRWWDCRKQNVPFARGYDATPLDPVTQAEWQEAVDLAETLLLIDSARQYGLIETDLKTDLRRCDDILARGRARGYHPAPHKTLIERYVTGMHRK